MSARHPIAGPDEPIPGAADLRGADPALMNLASESAAPVPEALPVDALGRVRRDAAAAAARAERALAGKDARLAEAGQRLAALTGVEAELAAAQARLAALESGAELKALRARVDAQDDEIARLRADAREHAAQVDALQRQLGSSEHRLAETVSALAERDATLRVLEALFASEEGAADGRVCDGDCGQCPDGGADEHDPRLGRMDLCGLRILCVGGRGSLNAHYRSLVKRCNGELLRHDGGLEDNRARLEALLASADAVICPLDSVSHDASLRTKRFCKRHAEPCVLLKRSGVGAFALALSQLTAAQAAPAGAASLMQA